LAIPKDCSEGGYNIKRMLTRCSKGKMVGFDISEESVKKARKVKKERYLS